MENKQLNSKKLGHYIVDKMLDNTVNIFGQDSVAEEDIETTFERNNQLADIMTLVNLKAFVTFANYSKELNSTAVEHYKNKTETYKIFTCNCRKLHDEINCFISTK